MSRTGRPSPEEVQREFLDLLERNGLAPPDEIRYEPADNEILCFWEEQRLVVAIDLDDTQPIRPPV